MAKIDELRKAGLTIKETADCLGVHQRTVIRMLKDGRLEGQLVETLTGKVWLIHPLSIAILFVEKENLGTKQYPRADKKKGER